MNRALLVLVLFAGCKKTRVAECDALLVMFEKIEKCPTIPAEERKSLTTGLEAMRSALKAVEDVGDPPKEQLDMLRGTCRSQRDSLREMYEKVAPECLK
jgi:hypothetical protein